MDAGEYFKFTTRSRLDKSINSLLGIVEGITIDSLVDEKEINYLAAWVNEHNDVRDRHPFNELIPVVADALEDNVFDEEERLNVKWLCERLRSSEYYDWASGDMQRLHAILGAIASDGQITELELENLSDWLAEHDQLRTCWPYDEIDSLITSVMRDQKIDQKEHSQLLRFFADFLDVGGAKVLTELSIPDDITISGVCSVCPEITFDGSVFCFTGASSRYTRSQFVDVTAKLGGKVVNGVSKKLNYLVIGAEGNPCWAYSCYGRKVEEAMRLRREGHHLVLVHENDFHDAVADRG